MANYIYNHETKLWYKITATIENGTGNITLQISQDGVEENPNGYIPQFPSDPLTTLEFYVTYFQIDQLSINEPQFNAINKSASRYVERYCNRNWVDQTVPDDLQMILCHMIHDKITSNNSPIDSRFKSESVTNYSYSVNDGYLNQKQLFEKYNYDLDMFRIVSYA